METRTVKIAGSEHPILITPNAARIIVSVAGRVIADTRDGLTLQEASYRPVYYLPREDTDMSLLMASEHTTYCPYKGPCVYFSITVGGTRSRNAVWSYEAPFAAVAAIKDYLAFYPDRVDSIEMLAVSSDK